MKDPEFPAGVLIGGRRSGRTTACLEWLLKGHPTKDDGRTGWSRLLIVTNNRMLEHILRGSLPRWHEIDHLLQQRGLPHGLAGCTISAQAFRSVRRPSRRGGGPEVMVDDADLLIQQALGFWPDYLVVTGRPFDPAGEPDPWERAGSRWENGAFHDIWMNKIVAEEHSHRDPHYRRFYEGRWEPNEPEYRDELDRLRMLSRVTKEDYELRHELGSPDSQGGRGDLGPSASDGPGGAPVRPA